MLEEKEREREREGKGEKKGDGGGKEGKRKEIFTIPLGPRVVLTRSEIAIAPTKEL